MLVYSNSCSFGAPNQGHTIYPEIVAKHLAAQLVNEGMPASCNRRIIRTTLRSLIKLKNNYKSIVALIGLTYISRTELWQPFKKTIDNDGDFHPISNFKIQNLDWSNVIFAHDVKEIFEHADQEIKDYYKQWLIHMNKEAEVTNLLTDVILLSTYTKANNIKLILFNNTQKLPSLPDVDINSPFLKDFVTTVNQDQSVINLWDFTFRDYALSLKLVPKDFEKYGIDGHPGEEAHAKFGNYLIDNYV
jgi:hypothetical protein